MTSILTRKYSRTIFLLKKLECPDFSVTDLIYKLREDILHITPSFANTPNVEITWQWKILRGGNWNHVIWDVFDNKLTWFFHFVSENTIRVQKFCRSPHHHFVHRFNLYEVGGHIDNLVISSNFIWILNVHLFPAISSRFYNSEIIWNVLIFF